jgi:hypothetical protein
MDGNNNISEELRLISELLATISRVTPYGLPDGYFEGLADRVLDQVRAGASDDTGMPDFLGSASSIPAYSVPEGYFEGFAGKLMDRIKAADTPQKELALLSPLLSRIDRKMPFGVPDGYFDELSGTMAANLRLSSGQAETENLSPLLAGLKDKQVYQTPKSYFESFPDTVLATVKEQAFDKQPAVSGKQPGAAAAKVFSISRTGNWWKYSAAAAIVGLILTGGWLWTHTSVGTGAGTGNVDIAKSLPAVSDQDIENYLDTNNVTNNVPLTDDLANSTASLDISDNDIKSFLGDVPDGELKQYIDEHGDVKNLATN